ncbi:MAG: hypothetical protein HN844_01285 [Planctomycetes bacterium]|jgi:hypothetical protein|nr:hypothetical protein [Planctomycetota bacterium]
MNEELRTLLILVSISLPVGLILGLISRKKFPESCKRYTKYSLDRKWPIFAFGALLFGALAVLSFLTGRVYFGWFFVAFACFELWVFFAHGFKSLSEEMEKRIDESDPTKLVPFKFWK